MSNTQIVPVVFACDNAYSMPLGVALESLLMHKSDDTIYAIYCMVPAPLEPNNLALLQQTLDRYPGNSLEFVNMNETFSAMSMKISHISYVTYYRLKIASTLSQYNRCIYLDVDLVILDDLTPLMSMNLTMADGRDALLAAVPHAMYRHRRVIDGFPIVRGHYVNAGVLVMNLKTIREENFESVFLDLMKQNFRTQDQDILNVACTGRICKLDLSYNFIPKLSYSMETSIYRKFYRNHDIDFDAARLSPKIVHYADKYKPWQYKYLPYGHFWEYAFKNSSFSGVKLALRDFRPWMIRDILRLKMVKIRNKVVYFLKKFRSI